MPRVNFRVPLQLCFQSLSAELFIWNVCCMQFYLHADQSHFHKKGFALRLAWKLAQDNSEMAYSFKAFLPLFRTRAVWSQSHPSLLPREPQHRARIALKTRYFIGLKSMQVSLSETTAELCLYWLTRANETKHSKQRSRGVWIAWTGQLFDILK